jgi:hypothetical protein
MAKAKDKEVAPSAPTPHVITGNVPFFGDDLVLHQPGEIVRHDPDTAGDNLEPVSDADIRAGAGPAQVEVAPVAPSSPNASQPQGAPAGAVQSGGGSFIQAGGPETDGRAQEFVPLGGANEAATGGQSGTKTENASKG